MKLVIEPLEEYDRYIKYVVKDGKVIYIDFLQGIGDDTFKELSELKLRTNLILEIYQTLIAQEKYLESGIKNFKLIHKINYAIELYCTAFIYQEIEY
jgi:deoxyhypusine synthase